MTDSNDDLFQDTPMDARILDAGDDIPTESWAKTLVRVIEVQEAAFKRAGKDDEEAFKLARIATLALAQYMGGASLYIPRGDTLEMAVRDAAIFRDAFRGNVPDLAQRYKLTHRHIWRILNRQQKLHIRKLQRELFDEG